MDKETFVGQIKACAERISELRKQRQAIGSSEVKAWITEVQQLLRTGGKNTSKLLQNFQKLKFGAGPTGGASGSGIKFQSYQAELDTAEKLLKNAIQTIQIFGISEEHKVPDWFKREAKTTGIIKVGNKEVDIKTITVMELLTAITAYAESDKSLDESLKKEVKQHLDSLKQNTLLQPFLHQSIDKAFSKL